ILGRSETSPDDFHGMVAARAVVPARGGMTSHAAAVARGVGTTRVVGASELHVRNPAARPSGYTRRDGEWVPVRRTTGRVLLGKVPTVEPEPDEYFNRLMQWADSFRRLSVRTNADTPQDAQQAREFGAEGIGLCRTEHMFFNGER